MSQKFLKYETFSLNKQKHFFQQRKENGNFIWRKNILVTKTRFLKLLKNYFAF